ncbi:hypothetical protein H0266_08225 [Halobacillus locisalis]|uniref:Lipoprotein n=1 Tax=Halobacillus locisalis TaxID=220753 RepID=A0A838CTD7_9BACI|nr:hypothetical protein [Halobacillus locisalis]MBA2174876.1 hypothetical protein [Halobacillus locisalis]
MKNTTQMTKHLLILLFAFILIGCSNESPEEAINNGWSSEIQVNDIISRQKTDDGRVVLFTAQGTDEGDRFEKVGFALLKRQSNQDWEFIVSNMTAITDDSHSTRHSVLHYETDDGNVKKLPIAFGHLKNKNITTVTAEVNGKIKEIEIIDTKSGRYFYQVNAWGPIEFLNSNGEVMDQYGI